MLHRRCAVLLFGLECNLSVHGPIECTGHGNAVCLLRACIAARRVVQRERQNTRAAGTYQSVQVDRVGVFQEICPCIYRVGHSRISLIEVLPMIFQSVMCELQLDM